MKKLLAWILALGSVLGLAGCSAAGTRPYKELDTTEVLSATVQLTPPDTTLQIEDLHELVEPTGCRYPAAEGCLCGRPDQQRRIYPAAGCAVKKTALKLSLQKTL